MKGRIIALSAVGILILLGVAWFLSSHDRVPSREWVGPSGEARLREFLAAARFAERMGLKVSETRSLPELEALSPQAILVMPRGRQNVPPARIAAIVQWVERGGHLIAEAEYVGVADRLLDALGVTRSSAREMPAKPLAVDIAGQERKLAAHLMSPIVLDTAEKDVRVRAGASLVSYARGRGLVTVASTLRFARNPGYDEQFGEPGKRPGVSIGAHDHAELLWTLLTLSSGREASLAPRYDVQIVFSPPELSFLSFLREHAMAALIAAALLLALWIWSIVPRFGPLAPDPPPGRRRLLDHLRASGRYYWAKGLRSRLVVAARDAALRRVVRAQPDFAAATQTERAARLSTLAGISKEAATAFMSAAGAMRGADFIRVTQDAQRIHSALEKGSRPR